MMKKTFAIAFLTLAAAFGVAQETTLTKRPAFTPLETTLLQEKFAPKKSFGYLRMGVSDTELARTDVQILPGVGLGYRLVSGSSAIDLSASFNRRKAITDEGREETYHYTMPKANYLYYINADANNSLYVGGGLAWGGVETRTMTQEKKSFMGIIPNIALGYELNRTGAIRSFVQLDASQPAIAALKDGAIPKPFAELSFGAGF